MTRRWRVIAKWRWRWIKRRHDNFGLVLGLPILCWLIFELWRLTDGTPSTTVPEPSEITIMRTHAVLVGLATTILLGLCSGGLLNFYVTVKHPETLKKHDFERKGGGAFLGFLERILFFVSFWHSALIGGAWLAFKLGAKWKVWEQIIKVPDIVVHPSISARKYAEREQLASRVLGRFLNGTAWNLVCGMIGAAVTTALWSHFNLNPPDTAAVLLKALEAVKSMR